MFDQSPPQAELQGLIDLYNANRLVELVARGEKLAARYPRAVVICDLVGKACFLLQRAGQAADWFLKGSRIAPDFVDAHFNLGLAYRTLGRLEEAVASYGRAVRIRPDLGAAHDNLGEALLALGRAEEALAHHQRAAALNPDFAMAQFNIGRTYLALGMTEEDDQRHVTLAIPPLERAIAIQPAFAEAHSNLGTALKMLGRSDEAMASYARALEIQPDLADAHNNIGALLVDLGRTEEAVASYGRALEINPGFAQAHYNLGHALTGLDRQEEAVASYRSALNIAPDLADAHYNLGNSLRDLGRLDEAVTSYGQAVRIDPGLIEAYNNLGVVLDRLGRLDEAIAVYQHVLTSRPDHWQAHYNLGTILQARDRADEAIAHFEQALRSKPDFDEARVQKLSQQALVCDWEALNADALLIPLLGLRGNAVAPFAMLAFDDDPERNRRRSEQKAAKEFPRPAPPLSARPSVRPERIRIGYFSANFHDHPVMQCMTRLFELHDRSRFSVHLFSYGPDDDGEMRERLRSAADAFHEVRGLSDREVADFACRHQIDIGVDLMGYTHGNRLGIFARRAAPVQISYLGFPGTLGAPFIDYIVADKVVIPENARHHYSENIIYLPDSYQVNDDRRPISDRTMTRAEFNLPEDGFVFCCFNNPYKITPVEFDIWMRLLGEVDGSVLWLFGSNRQVEVNLRKEAQKRGIGTDRLIFADRLPLAEHLARHRLADLALDTFKYNGHATTSHSLWAGLPVLATTGRGFAARVSSSLLAAVGLPELITQTPEEYEGHALALARDPDRLSRIRAKLASNRPTAPLFDSNLSARHFETAYEQAWQGWFKGRPPADIMVP